MLANLFGTRHRPEPAGRLVKAGVMSREALLSLIEEQLRQIADDKVHKVPWRFYEMKKIIKKVKGE